MLTLARRLGEVISLRVIHADGSESHIAVGVTELSKSQVKLGFVAPPSIVIEREEIGEHTPALTKIHEDMRRKLGGD